MRPRPGIVESPLIASASLHVKLPRLLHVYVTPFIFFLYPIFAYSYYFRYQDHIGSEEWTFVMLGSIITLQALAWLSVQWSVKFEALFTARGAQIVRNAQLIKVIPTPNQGKAEMCVIEQTQFAGEDEPEISFIFQKKRFTYSYDRKCFTDVKFPIDSHPPIGDLQNAKGLYTAEEIRHCDRHFGKNRFDIPIPTFKELFQEHAVAPFFVFQIFCVGLWCLDEYWYYSLFTLFMLVVFESTVVWQRQRSLQEFRTMSIKPYPIYAYRENKWIEIETDAIYPGDLVSVVRTKEDSGVPCDLVLLSGSCIVNEAMLSGESTPLLKESISLREESEPIDPNGQDKNSMLYGGTKVLQTNTNAESGKKPNVSTPPDHGVLAVVIRTGFETSQGSLVRTMIYSTERVSANNLEALFFILFLLVFAIAASWYVWVEGVRMDRKRSKLLLDCILIITSVVPPELPMELSLAVNTSLAALSKFAIFCTEPFRIPAAGKVDVCCFDKTGTLTGEQLVVEGVAGLKSNSVLRDILDVPDETTLALATAHSLVRLEDGEIVGDPLEKATIEALKWRLGDDLSGSQGGFVKPASDLSKFVKDKINIRRRFQFSSALKRQCSIAQLTNAAGKKQILISVKGAPETLKTMMDPSSIPSDYDQCFGDFTRRGSRVLALGYRWLNNLTDPSVAQINALKRDDLEKDLKFAGFLVFHCPLKEDAVSTVKMLNDSAHRSVMITGDNPLTAVHVAKEVAIVERDVLILDRPEDSQDPNELLWHNVDFSVRIPFNSANTTLDEKLFEEYDICITGYGLSQIKDKAQIIALIKHTWVYARVSPIQKEFILTTMKEAGLTTLMCGDGTNDVGALKQANIGVALLNGSESDLKRIAEHQKVTRVKTMYEKQVTMMRRWAPQAPPPLVPVQIAHLYPEGPRNPHRQKALNSVATSKGLMENGKLTAAATESVLHHTPPISATNQTSKIQQKLTDSVLENMMEDMDDEPPTIKLGDASVAAPFTSKLANVVAIANIIRQGRCTLVATIQMYKILALNCLISAYSLSVLYLKGIKFGDGKFVEMMIC